MTMFPSFSRLSTGMKMLLILTVALMPLGLIAIFASIESAQTAGLRRADDARAMASQAARQLSQAIGQTSLDLRAATASLDYAPMTVARRQAECRSVLATLRDARSDAYEFGIFASDGTRVCTTRGFSGLAPSRPQELFATEVRLIPAVRRVQFEARSPGGALYGVAEAPLSTIATIVAATGPAIQHGVVLRQEGQWMVVRPFAGRVALGRRLVVSSAVANGQITLDLVTNAVPIGAIEILLALLPILMWVSAGLIGWLVVDRSMIRPLLRLQRVVSDYRPDAGPLEIPRLTTPAREIRDLGAAFQSVTERIAQHESEMAESLLRQTKLTREVHHRVKNNLQVVASLINIHARGVEDRAVADAYASIQRRVDALSVVHRNHFAELEANRGVDLRALIGELAANLRGTASPGASRFAIALNLMTAFCTQDVALPVAFLVTELVEAAMIADGHGTIRITLVATDRADRATLTLATAALAGARGDPDAREERFRRVVEGLSRQLRAKMTTDDATGSYQIEIPILPDPA
jgi:two-component sensor histidine kinase